MNNHNRLMLQCINLALKAGSNTWPNPLVGCIIVKNNKIISRGFHKKFGREHAEVNAIKNSEESVEGASLYVNLEPCSHYGKTPPCVDLIIKSKIKEVFIGMKDPNPVVSGRGIEKLKKNGINVIAGILEKKCEEINKPFIKFIKEKRSYINLKIASTIDGKIAEHSGYSKWITNEKSRKFVHKLRRECNAIMVGANTIIKDNPQLNVREKNKVIYEPFKLIVTNRMNFPDNLTIFNKKEKVVFITGETNKKINKFNEIRKIFLPENKDGTLNLKDLDKILYINGFYNVFAEGGSFLNSELIKYNMVDRFFIFFANKILGDNKAIPMFSNLNFSLNKPYLLDILGIKRFDDNFMIKAYPLKKGFKS